MSDSFVQIPPDSTGKLLRTNTKLVGTNTVHSHYYYRVDCQSFTVGTVTGVTGPVTLLASNTGRTGMFVFNDSTANLFLKYGASATVASFTVKITAGAYYEMPYPMYIGDVTGVWSAVTGAARVTETL